MMNIRNHAYGPAHQCLRVLLLLALLLPLCSAEAAELSGLVRPANQFIEVILYSIEKDGTSLFLEDTKVNPKNGSFRFDVQDGTYVLVIRGRRLITKSIEASVRGGSVQLGTIDIQPAAWLTGCVDPLGEGTRVEAIGLGDGSSAVTDVKGCFTVMPLVGGKYRLRIRKEGYLPYDKDIDINPAKANELPLVKLTQCGKIAGRISVQGRQKAMSGRPWTALWKMAAHRTNDQRGGYETSKFDEKTGAYDISNLAPGRYDLLLTAPGLLVRGVAGLPSGDLPDDDMVGVKTTVESLVESLGRQDATKARNLLAEGYVLRRLQEYTDVSDFMGRFGDYYALAGSRDYLMARSSAGNAILYTWSEEGVPKRDPSRRLWDEKPAGISVAGVDAVERWELVEQDSIWKLKDYTYDAMGLGSLLWAMRIYLRDTVWDALSAMGKDVRIEKIGLPRVQLVLTDDPRFVNVEVVSGQTSKGHDWTVQLSNWVQTWGRELVPSLQNRPNAAIAGPGRK